MDEIKLIAQERSDYGRKASRTFRKEGLLPANIYGLGKENLTVTVNTKEFTRIFMAGHRIFTLEVGDGKEQSVVKEVQYDNLGSEVIHVDFTRIDITQKITLDVGVELIGTVASGMLQFPMKEVKVESLPAGFPASISINVIELKIGDVIRIEDLEVPDGCVFTDDPDALVLQVVAPIEEVEEEAVEEVGEEADGAEPEVIGKPQEDGEEEGDAEDSGE
ncbi:MAG: 50S ribosomal protein L25 [Planctomycetes bacterium]|nr:50S ribosomal protein L25 [Planctomycetota bacterium]